MKPNIFDIVINFICMLQLFGIVIYLIVTWNSLPEQIPGHFGADGVVTRYDGKWALLVMPILAWLLFGGLSLIERFPQIWNTGVQVTKENKFRVYRILKNLLCATKLILVTSFIYVTIIQSLSQNLSRWFVPVFLFLLFGSMAYFAIMLIRAK